MKKDAVAYLVTRRRGDIEHQREVLEQFCKYRFTINTVFNDHRAASTPPRKRDGYNAMLQYCREHMAQFVIFLSLSDIARNPENGIDEIHSLISEGFVPFFAKNDFIGYVDNPELRTEAIGHFVEYMGTYAERVRKAQSTSPRQESRTKGAIGRPKALNEGQIEALITVRRSGTSISQICRMFNVSRSTVSKILTDYPELKGEWKGRRQDAEEAGSE
ncbi:recombinase family protein [Methanofollis fontis]|uniref:Resolvase n=1 Tax=Methanofollis fontis TaxID=2052832 RepID=A0A483CYP3_9EURY|nr:recombinase family protein [Methanofollis fontis]TAJ45372.1 resolvase [Methanofollis fontis]